MELLLATQQSGILMPFAWILGKILEAIYFIFSSIGIESIGLCIIVFTVVIRMLMLPSTIKQQKFSKLNSVMNPEIQAIQKKYANKKDNDSMMKQQAELNAVYQKYGTTVRGSVMNPNDHPHGGGEGKTGIGRPGPCTPWGKPALGLKTRKKNKNSNKLIVRRRDGKNMK